MRLATALPALLALAAGPGCLRPSPSPPVVFYTLAPLQDAGAPAPTPGPAVEVLPVRIPELLQRPQMLVPEGAGGLALLEASRWGNPLDKDLQRVLVRNLSLLLGSEAVVASPDGARAGARFQVRVDVRRWDARGGQGLVLEAAWMIFAAGGGQALAIRTTRIAEPLADRGPEALAAAHSRLAERLSREIAGTVQASLNR
jgi:uncharacterized lipoprotein YmbA